MESLTRTASKVTSVLRRRRCDPNRSERHRYQLEDFSNAYQLLGSFIDDRLEAEGVLPAEVEGVLPDDLHYLLTEAQRVWRRFIISHPIDEVELHGALNWMRFNGNSADLEAIRKARSQTAERYPESLGRLDRSVEEIKKRVDPPCSVVMPWRALTLAFYFAVCLLFAASLVQYGTLRTVALSVCLLGGGGSALFLLREGLFISKGWIRQVCLIAAAVLLLIETAQVFRVIEVIR